MSNNQVLADLVTSLEKRDSYTAGHSERVANYAGRIAKELGFSPQDQKLIHLGGLLHDIGKIGIPDYVLDKEGPLTEMEYCLMKQHPVIGEVLLGTVYRYLPLANEEEKERVLEIVLYHHERPDGKGYPRGLSEAKIPTWAMIMSVADAYDAMTSDRSYRQAMSHQVAMDILMNEVGTQFWAPAVGAFVRLMHTKDRWVPEDSNGTFSRLNRR